MHGQKRTGIDLVKFENGESRGGLPISEPVARPNQCEEQGLLQETIILSSLLNKCRFLVESKVAICVSLRYGITFPEIGEGKAIGVVYAWNLFEEADYFSKVIEFWGFAGIEDFFSLSPDCRAKFLDNARTFVESIFGHDLKGLETLCEPELEPFRTKASARLGELKAEDVEREVRAGLARLTADIKEKAIVTQNTR